MATFPSLYRAKAVDTTGRKVTAFVPAVFGEEPITITEWIGNLPGEPGMGWVFFQAGNPEFPVWVGGASVGDADEVYIGPTDPGPGYELWYDTDDHRLYARVSDAWVRSDEVLSTRLINTTLPLTGGGDLTADRTLAINPFSSTTPGVVAASGGGTTKYLRADGTWIVPPNFLPAGGTAGQYLNKINATDYNAQWITPPYLDQTAVDARVIAVGDPRYVNVGGDTMTGALTVNTTLTVGGQSTMTAPMVFLSGGFPAIRIDTDASWIGFYNAGAALRRGYLQGHAAGISLVADIGVVAISSPGGLNVSGGRTDLGTLGLTGCSGINFSAANPSLTASSYIIMGGGLFVSGGTLYSGATIQARGGIMNDSGSGAPGVRITGAGTNYPSGWAYMQLQVMENSGAQHSGMCFNSGPMAPLIRDYGPYGDRIDTLNNPNTSYCSVAALSFAVQPSSERNKHDIRAIEDDELLDLVSEVQTHRFTMNIGPMSIPLTDYFIDLNKRWLAKGHRPLTPTVKCFGGPSEPHDCANPRHWCLGAPGHPCPIARNDTPRYGLIAEHLSDHLPESVFYDEDEQPAGYEIDQIAAMAFGGVGALLRRMNALQARVDELELAP